MGKPKVYGKKNRNVSTIEYSVFAGSSPSPEKCRQPKVALAERSHNALIPQHDHTEALPDTATLSNESRVEELKVKTLKNPKDSKHPAKTSTQPATNTRTRKPQQKPAPPKPPAPPQADLSATLENLHITKPPAHPPSLSSASHLPPTPSPPPSYHSSLPPPLLSHLSPLLSLKTVSPTVSNFTTWLSTLSHLSLAKIGEGSFGEVYRATSVSTGSSPPLTTSPPSDTPTTPPSSSSSSSVILKILPLSPSHGPGSKSFTPVPSAAREIRLLSLLQRVPGFVEFRGACVVRGMMPARLVECWREYKERSGRTVESRDPRKKGSYGPGEGMCWFVVEMSDAGGALEGVVGERGEGGKENEGKGGKGKGKRYLSARRTWDLWWGVVRAVAKAEVYCGFEHRDLHLGNVCARDTRDDKKGDEEDLGMVDEDETVALGLNRTGVEVTIIDYSLSRAAVGGEGGEVLFYDFVKDKQLLRGEGDLQYDVYRYMAAAVGKRSCREFVPETNVLWLWFLLRKLLEATMGLSREAKRRKDGRITAVARTQKILEELLALVNPEIMDRWQIRSAGELLDLGVEKRWFLVDEVLDA